MEGPAGKRMSSLQVRKAFWRAAESCSGSSYAVKPHNQVCCDCFRCIPKSDELRQRENLLEGYWVILHRWKHWNQTAGMYGYSWVLEQLESGTWTIRTCLISFCTSLVLHCWLPGLSLLTAFCKVKNMATNHSWASYCTDSTSILLY